MKPTLALVLVALAATAGPALAYGTLEPANELGTALRKTVADPAYTILDEHSSQQTGAPASRRIDYGEDNRTWTVYEDRDRDGVRDDGENVTVNGRRAEVGWYHVRADGNGTDHLEVNFTQEGTRFRVCTEDAAEGAPDDHGFGRGLRCNGDLDRDGEGDLSEIPGESPIRPGRDDDPLIPNPPPLLP